MVLSFKIIKLFNHHNRGQFIAARQLNFKAPVVIQEGASLDGVSVYHYAEMSPMAKNYKEPGFDIYVFRPTELGGYPKDYFREGQIVELVQIDHLNMVLTKFGNEIQESIPKLIELARSLTWNKISENYKFILSEIRNSDKDFHEQQKIDKKKNDKKIPITFAELTPTLQRLYASLYDIHLQIYRSTKSMTIIDFRYYLKSSLEETYRQKILSNPPMLHCKVPMPPWLSDGKEKFDINWVHRQWLKSWKLFWVVFLFSFSVFSQTDNIMINKIQKIVQQINNDSGYTIKKLDNDEFLDHTTDEGGELTAYFKNGQLVKIIEWIGLSSCVNITEYYLQDNKLIFTYTKGSQYSYNESSGNFDRNKLSNTMECRFYYDNDKLIRHAFKGETRCGGQPTLSWAKNDMEECERYKKLFMKK